MNAIVAKNLRKIFSNGFSTFTAVSDVSFEIPAGKIVGFIGANGAGKTTTMRMLSTIEEPTCGTASIMGYDVVEEPEKIHRILGWVPDDFTPFPSMTVLECLDFFARAMGFKGNERIERLTEIMNFTEITSIAHKPASKLSKGQTQRLCLSRALIHDPQVLILDEPAAGLDPKARIELRNLLRLLARDGKTILISSHILSELDEMCDSLLFIDRGKIIHQGSSAQIRTHQNSVIIHIQTSGPPEKLADWITLQPGVALSETLQDAIRVRLDFDTQEERSQLSAQLLNRIIQAGFPVTEFHAEKRSLEEAFIDIVSQKQIPVPVLAKRPASQPPPLPTASSN